MSKIILTEKELSAELGGRSRVFIWAMKKLGFRLPATQEDVVQFLRDHPHPSGFVNNQGKKKRKRKIGP